MKDAVSTHLNEHHRFEPVHPPAMSETPSSGEETVTIRVFSPSHEVPQRLVIPDIPVSLTLFDLKQRISAQIPIRPPPNVQRLICRGRILVGDDRKIGTVLDPQVCELQVFFLFWYSESRRRLLTSCFFRFLLQESNTTDTSCPSTAGSASQTYGYSS